MCENLGLESPSNKGTRLHTGSKQQQRSTNKITVVISVSNYSQLVNKFIGIVRGHSPRWFCWDDSIITACRTAYIWVLFFAHILFMVNCTFNATPTERLQLPILHCTVIGLMRERFVALGLPLWTHLRTRYWGVFTLQGIRRFASCDWPTVLRKL